MSGYGSDASSGVGGAGTPCPPPTTPAASAAHSKAPSKVPSGQLMTRVSHGSRVSSLRPTPSSRLVRQTGPDGTTDDPAADEHAPANTQPTQGGAEFQEEEGAQADGHQGRELQGIATKLVAWGSGKGDGEEQEGRPSRLTIQLPGQVSLPPGHQLESLTPSSQSTAQHTPTSQHGSGGQGVRRRPSGSGGLAARLLKLRSESSAAAGGQAVQGSEVSVPQSLSASGLLGGIQARMSSVTGACSVV